MTGWQHYLDEHQSRFVDELVEFLRIPSVSSLSEHAGDVARAAEWVSARLESAGAENVEIMASGGHPVVYGDWLHAPGKPTVVIYGHFDVQPAGPEDLWDAGPFEPILQDDRIVARGASDDKGNMLIPLLAFEALLAANGTLPLNVKFLLEGQEEIGSPQLPGFLRKHRDKLAGDLLISADGVQYGESQPALYIGYKGMCTVQVDVVGPDRDLHSGLYGGAVQNPIHALASILDSMRSADGAITVEGFFDDVAPLSAQDREEIAAMPHDDEAYMADLGVDALFGEPGYSTLERTGVRPTLEVNGIWGGFQDEGVMTVLPSQAHAKITCRLAPEQEPDDIRRALRSHVEGHSPPGIQATVTSLGGDVRAYLMPSDHPGNRIASEVLGELYGAAPFYLRCGGTLPICRYFLDILGIYTLSYAFGLEDENFHSPNEFFRLASFARGQRAYCLLLERLAEDKLSLSCRPSTTPS